jgi:hypothetical protein
MELTGKCKEDFKKWFHENSWDLCVGCGDDWDYWKFEELSESLRFGVYVDFFDSVELFPSINYTYNVTMQGTDWFHVRVDNNYVINGLKTRPEARKHAIEKSNELYNENK